MRETYVAVAPDPSPAAVEEAFRRFSAVSGRLDDPASYWVPIAAAAKLSGRTFRTVQQWVDTAKVVAVCDVRTRRVTVWLWSVFDQSDAATRRPGKRAP